MPASKIPVMAFLMMIGLTSGISQDAPAPDRAAYQSFFLVVAQLSRFVPTATNRLTEPTIQESLGFTDVEILHLNAVAADCEAKTAAVGQARSRATLEARFRAIETGDNSAWLAEQLKVLDQQTDRIVSDHVLQAQRLLGASRFQVVSNYIHSSFPHRCFVTPCGERK